MNRRGVPLELGVQEALRQRLSQSIQSLICLYNFDCSGSQLKAQIRITLYVRFGVSRKLTRARNLPLPLGFEFGILFLYRRLLRAFSFPFCSRLSFLSQKLRFTLALGRC